MAPAMSDLLRQLKHNAEHANRNPPTPPPTVRPRPAPIRNPHSIPETDDYSSSDSSAGSASSIATVDTIRPSSHEQPAPGIAWTSYFAQELNLIENDKENIAEHVVYLTPPSDPKKGPLFICHHGAGASGMSFACFAQEITRRLPEAGVLSLQARGHGSTVKVRDSAEVPAEGDYSIEALSTDSERVIMKVQSKMGWTECPPCMLVGHSLGGAVMTHLANTFSPWTFGKNGSAIIGYAVIDVVEGSALEALAHMKTYLASRPSTFGTFEEAIDWHSHSRTIRNPDSARASVPSLLTPTDDGRYTWATDLNATAPWWESWFTGMSNKFLSGHGAKLLILAGTDRLDRELMIGQMQGKFQLQVVSEAGHFVQEDVPEKTAQMLVDFYKRNDRSALVLPPKVADLIAQGKKV